MPLQNDPATLLSSQLRPIAATLYIPDAELSSVNPQNQILYCFPGESYWEALLHTLLAQISAALEKRSEDASVLLLSSDKCLSTVHVNLSFSFASYTQSELFTIAYCIVNTLTQIDDVHYVSIYVDDVPMALNDVPCGLFSRFTNDVATQYWQLDEATQEVLGNTGLMTYNTLCSVYFPTTSGDAILNEARPINAAAAQPLWDLIIAELIKGPRDDTLYQRFLPNNTYLAEQSLSEAGELSLHLRGNIRDFWAKAGIDAMIACQAIAASILNIAQNVSDVTLYLDDEADPAAQNIAKETTDLLHADVVQLFYPTEGTLIKSHSLLLPSYTSGQINTVARCLFEKDPAGMSLFEDALSPEDLLSISMTEQAVIVNISKSFHNYLRLLDTTRERQVVYCIVNTLCVNLRVYEVMLYVEGMIADNPVGRINLTEPLYYNPGIIQ